MREGRFQMKGDCPFLYDKKFRCTFFFTKKWQDFHRFVRQIFLTCHVPYDTLKLYIYDAFLR